MVFFYSQISYLLNVMLVVKYFGEICSLYLHMNVVYVVVHRSLA